jgi:hypothetical protein
VLVYVIRHDQPHDERKVDMVEPTTVEEYDEAIREAESREEWAEVIALFAARHEVIAARIAEAQERGDAASMIRWECAKAERQPPAERQPVPADLDARIADAAKARDASALIRLEMQKAGL